MRKQKRNWIIGTAAALVLALTLPVAIFGQANTFEIIGKLLWRSANPVEQWFGYKQFTSGTGTVVGYQANSGGAATGIHYYLPPAPAGDVSITPSGDNKLICYRHYVPYGVTVTSARVLNDILTDSGADETLAIGIYVDADAGALLSSGKSDDATTDAVEILTMSPAAVTIGPGMYRICGCAQDVSGSVFGGGQLVDDEFLDFANVAGDVVVGEAANDCTTGTVPATTGVLSAVDNGIIGVRLGP